MSPLLRPDEDNEELREEEMLDEPLSPLLELIEAETDPCPILLESPEAP